MPAKNRREERSANEERASRSALTVQYYCSISGNDGEPEQEIVTDLLTDLRHFCTGPGVDFDQASRMAQMHYEAEIDEEDHHAV